MRTLLQAGVYLTVISLGTGCLRTRAQLREDGQEEPQPARPMPAQVQEVQPQGQYVIDEIKSEITRLSGRVEDMERAQSQSAASGEKDKALREDIRKLETRIVELEQAQATMLEVLKKLQNNVPPPDTTELYEKGKQQLESGDLDGAVDSFSNYLKNPKAKHGEDATYLRGEAYYGLKQYKKAIIDYSKFTDKYASSKKKPAALFKIGLSFEALGMKQDAREFFADLVEKFPKSAEAKKAKAKLK